MTPALLDRALVEEATKKSGLIWVRGTGTADRALWHVWHEGAAYVVGGGPGEQPLEGLADGGTAEVTVRSKDKGGRLVAWTAAVSEVAPDGELWAAVAVELKAKRLNAPDGEAVTARWARECRVLCLTPREAHTEMPSGSLAARPVETPATTRRPIPAALPRLLRKRKHKRG
ncbi:hypothetical protein A8W25_20100 [Streptomyces sp. ERV7]|uniref:hypothetical protein n=1 Tax=Streptomyces sp. ERV7 TaxID=1322334 RepID=UPI0007F4C561|nr:hypothetical protein [Streptomyces sp. ERV7]OAR22407.1 hypothetical protein A8W25_22425 [Streptomyces sp. ERV7]OAR24672.1 hypothetical protein A8W25_20100 [Streptomyces sp. ERV7]